MELRPMTLIEEYLEKQNLRMDTPMTGYVIPYGQLQRMLEEYAEEKLAASAGKAKIYKVVIHWRGKQLEKHFYESWKSVELYGRKKIGKRKNFDYKIQTYHNGEWKTLEESNT